MVSAKDNDQETLDDLKIMFLRHQNICIQMDILLWRLLDSRSICFALLSLRRKLYLRARV